VLLASIVLVSSTITPANAGNPFNLISWLTGKGADVRPYECPDCGGGHAEDGPCITRVRVEDCVVGKKKVYDAEIRYEYVSIPETRYRWVNKHITKEIPCEYCKPVCVAEKCVKCYGEEEWIKHSDDGCVSTHCKHIVPKYENVPTKHCEHAPGETTITVHYKSCVKEAYTMYRRVKREVCVKLPRYEKVKVPITRYVCENCHGGGCSICK